jgi:hypothetical protein
MFPGPRHFPPFEIVLITLLLFAFLFSQFDGLSTHFSFEICRWNTDDGVRCRKS